MPNTLKQISEKRKCILTLSAFKLNTSMLVSDISINKNSFYDLVFMTPTYENRYGVKFKAMKKLNKKTTDTFLRTIFSKLNIEGERIAVFTSFDGKKGKLIGKSLFKSFSSEPFILLKSENGIKYSLFASIRNCLAHGNILKNGEWYYLFALSTKNNKISDEEKKLKFLLKIKDLNDLSVFCDVLGDYK